MPATVAPKRKRAPCASAARWRLCAKIQPRWKSAALQRVLALVGAAVCAAGFNRTVSINNWLFTTSPNNPITPDELRALTDRLRVAFPTHALVYRGIDPRQGRGLELFTSAGYVPCVHRPVHEWDPNKLAQQSGRTRYIVRQDCALVTKGPFVARRPQHAAVAL
jgi:hypothetical protein